LYKEVVFAETVMENFELDFLSSIVTENGVFANSVNSQGEF
jgi:hypothetical protein